MRFISYHEIEQGLVGDGVRVVVVGEFCMGNLISPGTRVEPTEDLKVYFNLLVNAFCLAMGLRVICSGEGEVIV